MILALDTSTPTLKLWLDDQPRTVDTGRDLARDLLHIIRDQLAAASPDRARNTDSTHEPRDADPSDDTLAATISDDALFRQLTGLIVYRGPGSFTGLRIGITVMNTLADALQIPIVGTTGDDWRAQGTIRLQNHDYDRLVLPLYGAPANVSKPRK
jgi:tRNA A37 threonylcarbamoyladenosine modification protein TsaB